MGVLIPFGAVLFAIGARAHADLYISPDSMTDRAALARFALSICGMFAGLVLFSIPFAFG